MNTLPEESPNDFIPEEMTFEEAIAKFYGEWVLFQVLEWNEHWRPVRGLVLTHSPRREDLSPVLAKQPRRTDDQPYQPYYTFNAFPRMRVGETREEAKQRWAIQRAAALDAQRVRQ